MNKSTLIAVVVFVALAVAAVLTLREEPRRGITELSLATVVPATVDRVLIGDDDGIGIEKKDGRWVLDGLRADATAVDRMIESLAAARSSDLASRNPERYAELEVDDEKGTRVRLFADGNTVADVVVGAPARGGSYVRSGDEVYTVGGIYRAAFARDREGWIERKVFFDEVDDVERVEVALAGAPPWALVEKENVWQLEDPALLPQGHRFDAEAATRLVRALITARAATVLAEDPQEPTGLDDGADRLQYRVTGDDQPRVLTLGAASGDGVYARSTAREHLLTLPQSVADSLRKNPGDLRDLGFVALDPSRVERLVIADGDRRLDLEKRDASWQIAESSEPPAEGFALDPGAILRRLAALARASAIAEAPQPLEAERAAATITATLDDDSTVVAAFGPQSTWQEREVVAVTGNVDDKTYLVETATRDQLLAGLESFARTAPPPGGGLGGLDPAALQNLPPDVRQALMKQMAEEQQRQEMMKRAMEAGGE